MLVVGAAAAPPCPDPCRMSSTPMCSVSRRAGESAPPNAADQDGPLAAAELEARQLGMMLEGRRAVAGGGGLRHPELHGVDLLGPGRVLLGVGHSVARRHEVQLPRPDELLRAQAVQVQQLAGHQPGDGLQAQVRMGADAERPARFAPGRGRRGPRSTMTPTVRRGRWGSTRRTGKEPTWVTRPGATSTTGPAAWSGGLGRGRRVVGGDRSTHHRLSYTFRVVPDTGPHRWGGCAP